jgi:hypothetical protein
VNFRGEKRSNATHESKTGPESSLARKGNGQEGVLRQRDDRESHGLVVDAELLEANGRSERDAALLMAERIPNDSRVPLATRATTSWPSCDR